MGIGQVIDDIEGEQLSYKFTLNKAIEKQDKKPVEELNEIGESPYSNSKVDTFIQRK